MEHIALYRAWRSQRFQDMVGQKHIIKTLQNAIRENKLSHAYLFCGPRGTGKTSAAKILAKAVNCEQGMLGEPCNECDACKRITAGAVMDVLEIDAASNRGVEEIRDLREKVKYAPTEVRHKVYIIDEVHMLTTEAFNALLKTLEEPPPQVMFILATTEPHRLPATVISRCQRFDFRRISLDEQTEHLKGICQQENIQYDDEAIGYIARLSDGGMRDAISILDQISSFTEGNITYEQVLNMTGGIPSSQFADLARKLLDGDIGGVLQMIEDFMQEGKSADKCMENLLYYFRDLLMIKMVPASNKLTERVLDPNYFAQMAETYTREQLFSIIDTLNQYQTEMKYALQPQMLFEVALLKLCGISEGKTVIDDQSVTIPSASTAQADTSAEMRQLKEQLATLENKMAQIMQNGVIPTATGTSKPSPTRSTPVRTSSVAKLPSGLEQFIQNQHSADFLDIQSKWSAVLQGVKEEKVTIHAWFVNGEPVSFWEDAVLVAFKNDIHRETTEKQVNKQLVEQVLSKYVGKSVRLVTMMLKDWIEANQGKSVKQQESPVLEMSHDDDPSRSDKPWVDEAIDMFGENLVVFKD